MMSNTENGGGWILLYHSLTRHWVWDAKPFSAGQAWVDLLLRATYIEQKKYHDGKLFFYEVGTVHNSIQWLSDRWGWDRKKTKRFLDALESDGMVTVNSTTHGTTITIENWRLYQNRRSTDDPTEGQRLPQPKDNGSPQYKERKRRMKEGGKNEEYISHPRKVIPPTFEMVKAYSDERSAQGKPYVDPEKFVDFYESNGWMVGKSKMRDWQAAFRGWEKNQRQQPRTERNEVLGMIQKGIFNEH